MSQLTPEQLEQLAQQKRDEIARKLQEANDNARKMLDTVERKRNAKN